MPEEALATGGYGWFLRRQDPPAGAGGQTSSRKTISVESDFLGPNLTIRV
jgi:hypothetical protein